MVTPLLEYAGRAERLRPGGGTKETRSKAANLLEDGRCQRCRCHLIPDGGRAGRRTLVDVGEVRQSRVRLKHLTLCVTLGRVQCGLLLLPLHAARRRQSLDTGEPLLLGLLGSRQLLCAQVPLRLGNVTVLAREVPFRAGEVPVERGEALLLLRCRLLPTLLVLEGLLPELGPELGLRLGPTLLVLERLLPDLGPELRFRLGPPLSVLEGLLPDLGPKLRLYLGAALLVREVRHGSLLCALVSGLPHARCCSALLLQDVALKFSPLYPFAGAAKSARLDGACRQLIGRNVALPADVAQSLLNSDILKGIEES